MTPFKAASELTHGHPSLHQDVATTPLWISMPVSHEHSVMYLLPCGEREYAGHSLHCSLIAGFHSPAAHADGSDTHVNACGGAGGGGVGGGGVVGGGGGVGGGAGGRG